MSDQVEHQGIMPKYTSTGRQSGWQVNLYHRGLNEHKHLSSSERGALEGKIHNQTLVWEHKWSKECLQQSLADCEKEAATLTKIAQEEIRDIENILEATLTVDDAVQWHTLMRNEKFVMHEQNNHSLVNNKKNGYPEKIVEQPIQILPHRNHFNTKPTIWDKLFKRVDALRAQDEDKFQVAFAAAEKANKNATEENERRKIELDAKQKLWKIEEQRFLEEQEKHNESMVDFKNQYEEKNPHFIVSYFDLVLSNSDYPPNFPQTYELDYNAETGVLLVDYQLPSPENLPKLNHVKFIKSRIEYEEKYLSSADQAKLYDSAIYQTALRTMHELFESDTANVLSAVNLNGYVTAINPSLGHEETNCVISVFAKKDDFIKINLSGIVSSRTFKECFKSLKGVGSSKLISLSSVKPLMEMNKSDKRFRDHYDVADRLHEEINIAAMDWQDFEHLIREIFAKEFTENGGEVKVTQASADGGVDAIAFDPDPIRGGKIVIQAKRYTNVVGVSAVRDLYGTVMNEGATKGILVTTSDFGPDSYEFAKGKPLTLLSGSNLLYLLEKHGHKAKIDIKEAKRILKDQAA
jgi:restriction system protein